MANRVRFNGELDDVLQFNDDGPRLCAVLFVDLNGFKSINDTFGHSAGDAVLRAVAERLRESVLGSDLSARLGGDEFAVLLTGLEDEAGAVAVARRISAAIHSPLLVAGQVLVPDSSIGVVVADPRACAAGVLLHRSDVAMYHAKRSRAPWVLYHSDLEMMSFARPGDEPPGPAWPRRRLDLQTEGGPDPGPLLTGGSRP